MVASEPIKHGLGPIARPDARLFILGSLPGDASLAAGRYYAHPRNTFWKLLGGALQAELHSLDYEERLERLKERRVGLWDVIAKAQRHGSLDQAIRGPGHNPLADYLANFPDLQAIAFNGAMAAATGRRLLGSSGVELIDLPSSSPANTSPFSEKLDAWRVLARFV